MNTIAKFLSDNKPSYVATIGDGKPHNRPFGASIAYEDKLYIITSSEKAVSAQFKANPSIEISATAADGTWLRLSAEVTLSDCKKVKEAVLEAIPQLQKLYDVDDARFEVFVLGNATGIIFKQDGQSETHTF
jgi:uncharacterized pyridoxamine 5'-phosphate oxidase family protein